MTRETILRMPEPLPTIKLWTPELLGLITFFMGFPSSVTLASINWIRMGKNRKAIANIVGSIIAFLLIVILPDAVGTFLGIVINLGYIAYLRQQMKSDIEKITDHKIQNANWFGGAFISLIGWVIPLSIYLVGAIFFSPGLAYFHDGNSDMQKGDYNSAITNYTKSIEHDPTIPAAHLNRGLAYFNVSEYDLAIADFNEVLALDPNYDLAYFNRALVYETLGRTNEAVQDFEKVLKITTDASLRQDAEKELQKLNGQ